MPIFLLSFCFFVQTGQVCFLFVETRRAFQLPRTGSALFYVCSGLNSSFFSVYDSNGTLDAIFSVLGKQCPSATRNMPTASAVEQFFFPPPPLLITVQISQIPFLPFSPSPPQLLRLGPGGAGRGSPLAASARGGGGGAAARR